MEGVVARKEYIYIYVYIYVYTQCGLRCCGLRFRAYLSVACLSLAFRVLCFKGFKVSCFVATIYT